MYSSPRDYVEKRDYIRMVTNCPIQYQALDGSGIKTGRCINLSARGLLIQCPDSFPVGTRLKVSVSPGMDFSKPLIALISISRCHGLPGGQGYELGCRIEEIQ